MFGTAGGSTEHRVPTRQVVNVRTTGIQCTHRGAENPGMVIDQVFSSAFNSALTMVVDGVRAR